MGRLARQETMIQESPSTIQDSHPSLYFVSDVHLGGGDPENEATKRERLLALCDRVEAESGSLYVLGDLFDFWFEYETVIPKTAFSVLARFDALARSGCPVHYLGGNHDFWICRFLSDQTAISVLGDGTLLEAQGKKARLFHGDGLGPGDTGYKVLKKILRNPVSIRLYRWLHPDLGIPFALRTSGASRHHRPPDNVDVESIYRHVAVPELNKDANAVLLGHHHVPIHWKREEGEMLILGDWFRKYTCVRLQDGAFELLTWPLDTPETP